MEIAMLMIGLLLGGCVSFCMRKYRKQSMGATHKRIWTKHRTYSS